MKPLPLLASAAMGLEGVISHELRQLGFSDAKAANGLVRFAGDPIDIARANLWLRSADRVKLEIGSFTAKTFEQLFDATRALPWADFLPVDASFPVRGRSVKSELHSVPDCQRIVKKAIVESLRAGHGTSQWLQEDGPFFPVEVAIRRDAVSLTIDASGTALHRRGYRAASGDAPLRETLAAALVQLSVWNHERPLVDPFCGSGTIAIEAALIGRNIAPGHGRHFAASDWPWIGDDVWALAREEAADLAEPNRPLDILGSDLDPAMIEIAVENARRAGVVRGADEDGTGAVSRNPNYESVRFKQMQASDFLPRGDWGVVITNPPYGQRSGELSEAEGLNRQLGKVMATTNTWSTYVYTAHPGFQRAFGREADRRRKLFNGPLEAQYYQYLGKRPPRKVTPQIPPQNPESPEPPETLESPETP